MPDTHTSDSRPVFPKRVLITGGMPYGNKDLHFGHVGGMFVHADALARFMRDRLGKDNVIFISGTDCYGSPIVEYFRQKTLTGEVKGTIQEFVEYNHKLQKDVLDSYQISLNDYAASGLGRSGEIHREVCGKFFEKLKANGFLIKVSTPQFYDEKSKVFLNGRQVVGRCPIPGCNSEKGYADECSLGHPYEPKELIAPKSTLSGETPVMKTVDNWYIDLEQFRGELVKWVATLDKLPGCRPFVASSIREFLEPPAIYVKEDQKELLEPLTKDLPPHQRIDEKNRPIKLIFKSLGEREIASSVLSKATIRFRNGKTLVPFRLTGNVEWGLPVPELESSMKGVTFWVWPESLWAPISFTQTYLEKSGKNREEWKKWWSSKDAQVYQFIGEDNVYFYSLAEMSMFMGERKEPCFDPPEGELRCPELVVNNHILFLDKKASSSGAVKPPMARDLLNHYTSDQLRAHFLALSLGQKSVSFKPKPYNPTANPKEADPALKDGNLLCNVVNRSVRSCFYTTQKFFNGVVPVGQVSQATRDEAKKAILDFESAMFRHEFHTCIAIIDTYARSINKFWAAHMKTGADTVSLDAAQVQTLVDAFYMVKVVTVLLHPIAPTGTEMIRDYLNLGEDFWSWDHIFEPIYRFMKDPAHHEIKKLEARVDFFPKHPSQFEPA